MFNRADEDEVRLIANCGCSNIDVQPGPELPPAGGPNARKAAEQAAEDVGRSAHHRAIRVQMLGPSREMRNSPPDDARAKAGQSTGLAVFEDVAAELGAEATGLRRLAAAPRAISVRQDGSGSARKGSVSLPRRRQRRQCLAENGSGSAR